MVYQPGDLVTYAQPSSQDPPLLRVIRCKGTLCIISTQLEIMDENDLDKRQLTGVDTELILLVKSVAQQKKEARTQKINTLI